MAPGPRAPSGRRWEVLGWLTLAGLLLLLVPLFLRMPTWTDVAFCDIGARHVLCGGALERDFLFLPPPGFVWARLSVRSLLGYSDFAVRQAGLAVVSGIVAQLALWLRALGLSRAMRRQQRRGRAWFGGRPQRFDRSLYPPRPYKRRVA